mgnify:FL=1
MYIDTILFSGGAIKGIGFVGCIKALSNYHYLFQIDKIKHYIGTSAGSIVATMMAIGYTIQEIEEIIIKINLNHIIDINCDNVLELIHKYGIVDGNKFEKTMRIIIEKITTRDLTFLELYQLYGKKLTINAVSIKDKKNEYFNYINTPHLNISKAVRMSCCVPILFQPYQYNNKLYVDGCLMDSISVNQIETDKFIGFYVEDNQIPTINNIFDFLQMITHCATYQMNNYKINDNVNKIHSLDFTDVQSLNFSLDRDDKLKIINSAYQSTLKFIENKYLKYNSFYLQYDENKVDNIINNIYLIDLIYI